MLLQAIVLNLDQDKFSRVSNPYVIWINTRTFHVKNPIFQIMLHFQQPLKT